MHIQRVADTPAQSIFRADLVKRLKVCLTDADGMDGGAGAAIEISMAIHHLGSIAAKAL